MLNILTVVGLLYLLPGYLLRQPKGWKCGEVAGILPGMCEGLHSIPSTIESEREE